MALLDDGLLHLIAFAAAAALSGCAVSPSSDSSAGREAAKADHAAWHAQRLQTLAAPEGWLTLVALDFLEEGVHSVGSSPDCALRYQGASAPRIGTIEVVRGDSADAELRVSFTPEPGVACELDGAPLAGSVTLRSDAAGAPSALRNGSLLITLVRRDGALALRVRDRESPVRTGFRGIELFPFDPSRVVEARVELPAPDERVAITNVRGFTESSPVAARLVFVLDGTEHSLVATEGSNGRLFVVFADTTNGDETYGGGRFLDVAAPTAGRTTIDFNRATNPPCAFTAFATCPMPPAGNRLPVAIRAGERAYGAAH
jgi:uncharacterized protein (DUF1684 family)